MQNPVSNPVFKGLKKGDRVNTKGGPAIVYSISSYGTRRGDIREPIRNSVVEYPTLQGLHNEGSFIGQIKIVPASVSFLYGHEAREDFIIDDTEAVA